MQGLFSKNSCYTVSLAYIPMLILMSWVNVSLGNMNYNVLIYIAAYVLPAIILSFAVAYFSADLLAEGYGYSSPRVIFSLVGLILFLLFFSYMFSFYGIHSLFVTAIIPASPDAQEAAAKFYSLELAGGLVFLALVYTIASYLFHVEKVKRVPFIWEDDQDEEPKVTKKPERKKQKKINLNL